MTLLSRPFAGEEDMERVVAFRRAISATIPNAPFLPLDDLRAHYLEEFPGWSQVVRLWEKDGELVGIGETSVPEEAPVLRVLYVRPRVHPATEMMFVGPEIMVWAEAEAVRQFGEGIIVEATVQRELPELCAMV